MQGATIFLVVAKGWLVSGPGKDFKGTYDGNKILDGCFFTFDGDSNYKDKSLLPRNSKDIVSI